MNIRRSAALALGLVFIVWASACGKVWESQQSPTCNVANEQQRLQGPTWDNTFGRSVGAGARACLRVSWGTKEGEGSSVLVEVMADGNVLIVDQGATGEGNITNVTLTLPRAAQSLPRAFRLLFFGADWQGDDTKQATLCQTMANPTYECLKRPASECWFALAFQPKAKDGDKLTPLPDPTKQVCQFFVRNSSQEPITPDESHEATRELGLEPGAGPDNEPAVDASVEIAPDVVPEKPLVPELRPEILEPVLESPPEQSCVTDERRICYTGPTATRGQGTCRAGIQVCNRRGLWSVCVGEIVPTPEACDRIDNDCDGAIDEDLNNCAAFCTAPCVSTFSGPPQIDAGPAIHPWLNGPRAIAFDGTGNVFVSDTDHHRILQMDAKGQVSVLAGSGTSGGKDGIGTAAEFNAPKGIAYDATRKLLYVADTKNHTIRVIVPATKGVTTIAGDGVKGDANGVGSMARFADPYHLAIESTGTLYIADKLNNSIRQMEPSGTTSLLTGGSAGMKNGDVATATFRTPYAPALSPQGRFYIVDTGNHAIRRLAGGQISTLAGTGQAGFLNGAARNALFREPKHAVVDASDNIYVADMGNHCIRKIDALGQVTTLLGKCEVSGYAEGNATTARLDSPYGLMLDGQGALWIADTDNDRVRKFIFATGLTQTVIGDALVGVTNGPANQARWNAPRGIASDKKGNLFVADTENHVIRKIDAKGQVTTLAGSGVEGHKDGAAAQAQFNAPKDMAIDSAGNVFVSDTSNHMIRKIDTNGIVTTIAGTGSSGATNGVGRLASFHTPRGITVDTSGNVYLADTDNSCIRKVDPQGNVTTLAGLCQTKGFING